MVKHNEFWQRPVTDRLMLELVPGDQPNLLIIDEGWPVLRLNFSEARALINALTIAVGELLILKKDPAALAQVNELLAKDVTLAEREKGQSISSVSHNGSSHVKGQELTRLYRKGGRSFARAELAFADLQGADLRGIDLSGADLTGANLKRANLFQANLKEANLSQANLEEAGLFEADLQGADLSRVNLRRAFLSKADLRSAQVTAEQLSQAMVLSGAILPDGVLAN